MGTIQGRVQIETLRYRMIPSRLGLGKGKLFPKVNTEMAYRRPRYLISLHSLKTSKQKMSSDLG